VPNACFGGTMSFIRAKKIKEHFYAYLVENSWKKKKQGSRQKVKAYLGRIISLAPKETTPFTESLETKKFTEAVKSVIRWQLNAYGFIPKEEKLISQDNIIVDFQQKTVKQNNANVALKINEGYLCSYTLHRLFEFEAEGYEEEVGLQLAEVIVGAGLKVEKQLFVQLFEKIYKQTGAG